jgi:hypothetical protein
MAPARLWGQPHNDDEDMYDEYEDDADDDDGHDENEEDDADKNNDDDNDDDDGDEEENPQSIRVRLRWYGSWHFPLFPHCTKQAVITNQATGLQNI